MVLRFRSKGQSTSSLGGGDGAGSSVGVMKTAPLQDAQMRRKLEVENVQLEMLRQQVETLRDQLRRATDDTDELRAEKHRLCREYHENRIRFNRYIRCVPHGSLY
jgi:predicted RNase H-like nuclease (RuvC/YqgF family)